MIIPFEQLDSDTLNAIIEDFVLREGNELDDVEHSKEVKIQQVKKLLTQGTVVLVYSELYESVNILPKEQFINAQHEDEDKGF
ncbi:YheU family protein [Litorilituus lipolyticus]|uniref:YheU family protein n=1 Tax=Litorilituus lipolyticus TaxID=2491017 RepID=A0A502KZW8_9GAMM|nr:YheU family protein [Litorilituus lipolyticus]TPH15233.1 YheU family protein [Litorilituus lipolyticus]